MNLLVAKPASIEAAQTASVKEQRRSPTARHDQAARHSYEKAKAVFLQPSSALPENGAKGLHNATLLFYVCISGTTTAPVPWS